MTKEILHEMHVEKNMTFATIAKELGVGRGLVEGRAKEFGVKNQTNVHVITGEANRK